MSPPPYAAHRPRDPSAEDAVGGGGSDDVGKLLLRLVIGLLVLLHGIAKMRTGPGVVMGAVEAAGLPDAIGYLVYIGEVMAPVLVVAGLFTRAAAAIVAFNMLMAFVLVHSGQIFRLGPQGGWALELQGLYLFGALAVMLLGGGRFSLDRAMNRPS